MTSFLFTNFGIPEIIFSSWLLWLLYLGAMYHNSLIKPSLQGRFIKLCLLSSVISILILALPAFAILAWGMDNVVWYATPIAIILLFGPLLAQLVALAITHHKGWKLTGLSIAYSPFLVEACLMLYIIYNVTTHPKFNT